MCLEKTQVGDPVIYEGRIGKEIFRVKSITKTMVMVTDGRSVTRVERSTGKIVGRNKWEGTFFRPAEFGELEEIRKRKWRGFLKEQIRKILARDNVNAITLEKSLKLLQNAENEISSIPIATSRPRR